MEKILIGKYVSCHGIKGEIKIKSNFKFKEKVFQKQNKIIIGTQEFEITNYRVHKNYDMLTLKGIDNINQIIELKGSLVYALKETLNLNKDEYLDTDLIGFQVYMNQNLVGKINDIYYLVHEKKLLVVNESYVPFELVKKIDLENKKVEIEEVEGLL